MENPLVSIIIPSFNSEKFISEAIKSVQKQTYKNWELMIVDDCSFDSTVFIIEQMARLDSRIQFVQLNINSGTGVARNLGLQNCKGRYIAFLDADDLWKPTKLEKQIDLLQNSNVPFTFSFYECIDESGNALNRVVKAPKNLSYKQLFFCNYVGNLTGIYDVNYFGKIAISSIRKRQDWMLWLTILKKLKHAKPVPESLAYYRIRDNSLSTSKTELLKHNYAVYRQFHGYNTIVSLFYMAGFLFTQIVVKPFYIKKIV